MVGSRRFEGSAARGLRGLAASLAATAALTFAATAAAAPPSLRVLGVEHQTSVQQLALRAGLVDLGVWVAPVGGAFQIDVRRPGYGAWSAAQVDSGDGAMLRPVPARLVDPRAGLKRFLSVRFLDSRHHVVAQRLVTFCPNGESARVNDLGPVNPTYPGDCNAAAFFPFVRGIVWGIDSGWAVAPRLTTSPVFGPGFIGYLPPSAFPPIFLKRFARAGINLKPGRYTAVVSITSTYRTLFAIPVSDATATIQVRVLRSPLVRGRPPFAATRVVVRPTVDAPASASQTASSSTQPDPTTMPNLVALPAWRVRVQRQAGRDLLTFAATIWNAGPAPFSIEGFRRPHSDLMDAYEYFFDSAGNVVGRAPAGTMFYDNRSGHHHWHLRQLASYELVGPSGQVVRSHKQSFCIAPTDAVDLTVPGAARGQSVFGGLGFGGSVCDVYSPDAIWLREQLPAGWGDTYQQSVAGQAFDITHLANGSYRIEVRVNPLGQLSETTTSDDLAVRVIRLAGRRGARRVLVSPWHGIRG